VPSSIRGDIGALGDRTVGSAVYETWRDARLNVEKLGRRQITQAASLTRRHAKVGLDRLRDSGQRR
jgi:hypothetical protein